MSNDLYRFIPDSNHQHEIAMLYMEKNVDIISININDLAYKYLEVRGQLSESFKNLHKEIKEARNANT